MRPSLKWFFESIFLVTSLVASLSAMIDLKISLKSRTEENLLLPDS